MAGSAAACEMQRCSASNSLREGRTMLVLKFGGTSVGSPDAFDHAADAVTRARKHDQKIVVVTSAMSGVTDALIASAEAAETGDLTVYQRTQADLLARHREVVEALVRDESEQAALVQWFRDRLDELGRLCQSIAVLGELTPRGRDVVSGLGERMSAPLLAAVLRDRGIESRAMEATHLVVTDDRFGEAAPIMSATCEKSRAALLPMLERGIVPVVTGFIGATEQGIPTTLGRGGSDFSASIMGACLDAEEIQIWTDVNGVMTANPRIVPEARTLSRLSYSEAAEMAYFGAKVLHPKTMLPAVEKDIPIRVLNTFNPDGPNTLITSEESPYGTVRAITSIENLSLINVEGRGMMGVPGIAARTFSTVAREGVNVLMISQASSEQSICFVIPQKDSQRVVRSLEEEMAGELARRQVDRIYSMDNIVILAIVGAGMRGTPGIAARLFGAMGSHNLNVIAIAQGSSEANISLVVARGDAEESIRQIHRAFRLDKIEG